MKYSTAIAQLCCWLCWLNSPLLVAQTPEKKPQDAPIPELFDDLPTASQPSAQPASTEKLGSQQDPFAIIAQKMQQSQKALTQGDSSEKTQQLQQDILLDLDQLLEQAKKQQCAGGNCQKPGSGKKTGAGNKPGSTGSKPGQCNGKAGETIPAATEEELASQLKEIWGHLPEKLRESMQNVSLESFLPKYQILIEEYYKKLAEQPASNAL